MPPAKQVLITTKDERSIEFRQGLSAADVERVGVFLVNAGQDGYELKSVASISGGHQRDPYTIGVRLTLTKVSS